MKLKNIFIAAVALAGLTGCQDWLDVQPKTEIKQDKMVWKPNPVSRTP